jgi:uncharacterized protein YkwD
MEGTGWRRREAARRANTLVVVAFAALAIVALAVTGVGAASAHHSKGCRYAHKSPRTISHAKVRHAVVCLINRKRHSHGHLSRLHAMHALNRSGQRHSKYMKRHGCFAHQCPGEPNLVSRVQQAGYLPCTCTWRLGETIAWESKPGDTAHGIVRAWMHSPEHRAILLEHGLDNIGVGVAWGRPGSPRAKAGTYTADFGYKSG